ncbi:pacifastin-like protease inhibitor cvp4 [Fopius arisanus]|uniref:Pacifastin-like protease inhibitor cvp4 n=1 Tax=Fopius arisanus TaxID=64838 RepID=A0A9R1SYG0_9HYME|nr:PREDICTED: pacifastin-like protease inhibitor cvp4 [Fopius arisanus]
MISKAFILAVAITLIVAEQDPSTSPCEPGTQFKHYCNDCTCSADGTGAACTRQACYPGLFNKDGTLNNIETTTIKTEELPALPADLSCVAGLMYKNDCNTCRCIEDNKPVCTLMACVDPPK